MAMCVIAVAGAAPCQCFTPGGIHTMSPGRISSMAEPQRCTRPTPAVTIRNWPRWWVCHAERAPDANDTEAPVARVDAVVSKSGATRTEPVKFSAGPRADRARAASRDADVPRILGRGLRREQRQGRCGERLHLGLRLGASVRF